MTNLWDHEAPLGFVALYPGSQCNASAGADLNPKLPQIEVELGMDFGNFSTLILAGQRRLKRPLSALMPPTAFIQFSDGLVLVVDPLDSRGPSFHMARGFRRPEIALGGYEPEQRKIVEDSLKALTGQPVFLDIGANIGLFSFPLAAKLPQVKIFGFEPHPRNANCFRQAIGKNSFANVRLIEAALGETSGDISLFVDESDSGGHSTLQENLWNNRSKTEEIRVPLLSLDSFVKEQGLERLDLLKIDVQGAESAVIRGGSECLRKHLPDFLIEAQHETVFKEGAILKEVRDLSTDYKFRTMEEARWLPLEELVSVSRERFSRQILFSDYFFSAKIK